MIDNTQQSAEGLGPVAVRAALAHGEPGDYYCQLYTESGLIIAPCAWQGPYRVSGPEVAAADWMRREWDCRHREEIRVAVKGPAGDIVVVRLLAKIAIRPLDICRWTVGPSA